MHFFFGFGAFFTPIIVKSFLNSNFDITITSNSFNCYSITETIKNRNYFTEIYTKNPDHLRLLNDTVTRTNPLMPSILLTRTQFTSHTKYAFWILAVIQLPTPIFLFLYMKRFNNNESQLNDDETEDLDLKDSSKESIFSLTIIQSLLNNSPVLKMTLLISFLVFLLEGLQVRIKNVN